MVNVSEGQRRQLHAGLVEKIGAEVADTLMDYLPHAGWSDLARKSDLDALESRLKVEISDLRVEAADLRGEMHKALARQTRWFMGSQLVLGIAIVGSITTIPH